MTKADQLTQLEGNISRLKLKLHDSELSHESISRINTTIRETEEEIKLLRQSPTEAPGQPHPKAEITANQAGAHIDFRRNRGGSL
ncbi:MAG: hypothetical protein RIE86_09270 [Imperialibacter sp.]|uniref:hypothetical protein n=1 Tax=Imperialibacter sp. TaxID=2038411 RepID=UPI0032ECEB22